MSIDRPKAKYGHLDVRECRIVASALDDTLTMLGTLSDRGIISQVTASFAVLDLTVAILRLNDHAISLGLDSIFGDPEEIIAAAVRVYQEAEKLNITLPWHPEILGEMPNDLSDLQEEE